MSKHPVTPAHESDLLLHLAKQTTLPAALIDILAIDQPVADTCEKLQQLIAGGKKVILFDALSDNHLQPIGQLIDSYAAPERSLFSVGSSGVEMALGKHWAAKGIITKPKKLKPPGSVQAMLVISGSCSPVTAKQIDFALGHGFAGVALDTVAITAPASLHITIQNTVNQVSDYIERNIPVIVHTSRGADDERIGQTYHQLSAQGLSEGDIVSKTAELYGTALGMIALAVRVRTGLKRLIIAGGDTSGYAARAMGIEALEMIAPLSPGAPLCCAHAPHSAADKMEVNFKGGQVGCDDYFVKVLEGKTT